jgi:hypothetical protein
MKKIKCLTTLVVVSLLTAVGCMNGDGSNSGEPVVTTPSASSSANSSASSTASPAASGNLSIMDSSYHSDTIRIDTIRK